MEITIDKQNLTPRIKKTGVLVYSELTNTLFIKSKNKGVMQIGSSFSSGDFVEKTTTIDINGVVQDLSASRTWTIFVPTKTSELTNDSGFITTADLSSYLTITSAAATYQPIGSYLTSITSSNVTTALGYTPYDATNPSGYITSSSLSSYVPTARTLTINGTTYDLTADRSWTISTGTTYTFSTGLTNIVGTITSNLSTGVSGGQSVVGGTSSGNNLTLSSTSNATKGKILFGTSAYDEVNNRLGVGTNSPSQKLSVNGNAAVGLDTTYLPNGITKAGGALLVGSTSLITSLGYGTLRDNVIQLGDNVSTSDYTHSPSLAFSTNQTSANQLLGRFLGLNSSLSTAEKRLGQISFYTDTATNNGKIDFSVNNGTSFITPLTIKSSGNVGIGTTTPSTALEIANGGTLKLGGGTASGQGNILMNSNASATYDTNVTYLGSNSQTMGMIASSTPIFDSSYGPSIFLRGNSYGAISGQRGIAGLLAGNPSSPTAGEGELRFFTGSNALRMVIGYGGNVGIGQSSPTAVLHLKAGTASANTAPLKFTSGTNLTTPENGAFEFDGTNLYFTVGGVRKTVSLV